MKGVLFVLIIPNPDRYPDARFCPPFTDFPVTSYCFVLPNQPVIAAQLLVTAAKRPARPDPVALVSLAG